MPKKKPSAKNTGPKTRSGGELRIAEALRLLRTRKGLSQTATSRLPGAPDFRTLSHWETGRKHPSLRLLYRCLTALDYDFRDLQDAIEQLDGRLFEPLDHRLGAIEERLSGLERETGEGG